MRAVKMDIDSAIVLWMYKKIEIIAYACFSQKRHNNVIMNVYTFAAEV